MTPMSDVRRNMTLATGISYIRGEKSTASVSGAGRIVAYLPIIQGGTQIA